MYSTIVVGTDGSDSASLAVDHASRLATLCGATVHLVSAFRNPASAMAAAPEAAMSISDHEWRLSAQSDVERMLAGVAQRITAAGLVATTHVRMGDPAKAIIDVADAVSADLIVVGNKGMKGARRLLGSVPNSVAHGAGCDVLVVRTA